MMPIRPEMKARYPKDWKQIRERILEREGHRCKWCKAPNRTLVRRVTSAPWCWVVVGSTLERRFEMRRSAEDRLWPTVRDSEKLKRGMRWDMLERPIEIVLTIAHVNDPNPENCEESNLAALCQRCHNLHDAEMRKANAAQTRSARQQTAASNLLQLTFDLAPAAERQAA